MPDRWAAFDDDELAELESALGVADGEGILGALGARLAIELTEEQHRRGVWVESDARAVREAYAALLLPKDHVDQRPPPETDAQRRAREVQEDYDRRVAEADEHRCTHPPSVFPGGMWGRGA